MIRRARCTGDRKSDPNDVTSESFVSDDIEIETVNRRKDSGFDSIMLELKLTDEKKLEDFHLF